MGFLSRFEGRMEDAFEGAADKMFDAPISPVQIAKKAEKQMRREKMVGAGKQYAPTLYTVLVNPDDDHRLFGYYPTLAGETETYLAAKASEQGLVMDGQPLVRFIVDDGLKHGKFDIIAEAVAAPIIAQLRSEEMQRYGLAAPSAPAYEGMRGGGYAPEPQPYEDRPAEAQPYDIFSEQPLEQKSPLPYVPEDEIDYGVDYGEYTFDSNEFGSDGAEQNGSSERYGGSRQNGRPSGGQAAEIAAGAAAGVAAGYAGAVPVTSDTVVFADGVQGAHPVPSQTAVRARLVDTTNNRTYDLATARLLIGRESKNDIVVHDINASRTHAELRYEQQGTWVVADLGSTNGTFVNGAEISARPLREGDRITVGMTNFVFTQA